MKALGIALIGLLAVAGGIAAAAYITKKKLEKQNEEDYYDDWDDIDWDDEDDAFDASFEQPVDITAADIAQDIAEVSNELIEDEPAAEDGGAL